MSPFSNTIHNLRRAAADCDSAEFQRRYGPSLRRIVRHMLKSGGGPPAWRPWLTDELKRLPPNQPAAAPSGDETLRRLTDRLAAALLRRGSRANDMQFETLPAA